MNEFVFELKLYKKFSVCVLFFDFTELKMGKFSFLLLLLFHNKIKVDFCKKD